MLRSRRALIIAFVLITLAGALSYAGPSAMVVLYRLIFDGGTVIAWILAAAGIGCWILGWFESESTDSNLLRTISAIALGLGTIGLATLALGLFGLLNHVTATALVCVGTLLGVFRLFRRGIHGYENEQARVRARAGDTLPSGQPLKDLGKRVIAERPLSLLRDPAGWSWLCVLACPFAAIALIAAMIPPGILWRVGDPSYYDVVEYHLQVPREWFEAGRIVPLSHNIFSFFPFNVEMHYLLAMHLHGGPWAGMYTAQLMHLMFVVLFVLAVYGFALRIAKPLPAIVAALVIVAVPWVTQLAAVAYDEGGYLLFSTLAISWTHQAIVETSNRTKRFALAGAFAGLACGAKLTAVPEVLLPLVIAAAVFVLWNDRKRPLAALRGGLVLLVTGLLTFSPWLARNYAWAHNPLFPEVANWLGAGHFTPTQIERWQRAHGPRPDQIAVVARLRAGWKEILASPQYGYVVFPLALSGFWFGRRRQATLLFAAILLALTLIWLFATHLEGRFFVLSLPLCALLIAQIDRPVPMLIALGIVLISAGISGVALHRQITAYLVGGADSPLGNGVNGILGVENISLFEADYLSDLPKNADVVLVGDAKAFWWTLPMSRLHYRTVFDVRDATAENVIGAWSGGPPPANARVIIDPGELKRFHNTYWKIALLPDWVLRQAPRDAYGRPMPFVLSGTRR